MNIPFTGSNTFNGIITFLYNKKRESFFRDVEAFGIKHTAVWADPINVFTPGNTRDFASKNNVNLSFIILHLKKEMIQISNYSFLARVSNSNSNLPVSWKLEGSLDNTSWNLIHYVKYTDDLNESKKFATYEVESSFPFNHFRLTLLKTNVENVYHLHVNRLEFFGTVYGNPFLINSCVCRNSNYFVHLYILVLLYNN